MDMKKLLGMRPKSGTLPDIQAALDRARAALTKAREDEAVLLGGRADLLLAGDANSVATGEADLARVRLPDLGRHGSPIQDTMAECPEATGAAGIKHPKSCANSVCMRGKPRRPWLIGWTKH